MFYSFACAGVRSLLRLLTSCRVEGLKNIPPTGPLLLVSNHLNLIDPPVLGALLPRRIAFMAKEEAFHTFFIGWLVRAYGAFRVRRGTPDRQALRSALAVLERGGVVGMFPEGHRSKTGRMNQAYPGAALIALLSGAPVLPVAITGTDRIRSVFSLFARATITVRVGRPFKLERQRGAREELDAATLAMMGRVAELLPDERKGYYAGAAGDTLDPTQDTHANA